MVCSDGFHKHAHHRFQCDPAAAPETGSAADTDTGTECAGRGRRIFSRTCDGQIDYEAKAKAKAEEILAAAQQNADAILAQANEDAEEIRTSAKTQGYEEGRASAEQENEQLRVQLEESYRKKQGDLDSDYRDKREHMEQDLVDVIVTVFEKVFHIQFDDKKEILMHLIEDAILNIEDDKRFRVKVAEDNALFLENHKTEILDRVGHDIELEIVSDATVEGNDCTIETDSGVFNCSLGTQLENLIKDIRSLCS